ncbi:MAG: hypothetical protein QNL03_09935 [Gammaproteobacteria bacterium]|nr:hypothetical protein [Gammaproteobacteria bacterium]
MSICFLSRIKVLHALYFSLALLISACGRLTLMQISEGIWRARTPPKHKYWKLPVTILLTLATSFSGALHADDYVHMIQYELLFGNKQPVSNLYMTMQAGGMERSLYATDSQSMIRTPVISTDPHKLTLLRPLSVLFAADEPANSNENGSDDSAPEPSVGHFFGSLLGVVLILGPMVYAVSQSVSDLDDICDDGCGVEVDIPEYELPEVPAETGS